jgi:hypothetical protein
LIRVAILCLLACPASAGERRTWPSGSFLIPDSHVTLHAPTAPHAEASVTFFNSTVHSEDETFSLTWGEIEIGVQFDWQAVGHAEAITITPPPGFVAIPETLIVDEDSEQTAHIYRYIGG